MGDYFMLRLNNNNLSKNFKLFIWLLMGFQAGYINVGGFVIFGNFVSHVTGTSSQIGMGIARLDFGHITTFITLILAFIIGAAFASYFLERRLIENKEPEFTFVTAVKASIFGAVLILSEYYFLNMNHEIKLALVFLLSLACGMQNATCSLATNGFLKPTHMTGLSTDIGINLIRVFSLKKGTLEYTETKEKNLLRIKILFSFISGGVVASLIFADNGHYGFIFPFVSSLCMLTVSVLSEKESKKIRINFLNIARNSIFAVFFITVLISVYSAQNI